MSIKDYLNASSEQCNRTVQQYVYNLTSSYTDKRNEAPMVATSVIMFILAALFFNLNLFSRLSDISTILNPSVRLFLSTSLSLFLPVMSYLFSEAKNDDAAANAAGGQMTELSVRARTILTWMLLVELLRRKVEAMILVTAGGGVQGYYSGTIERAARIAWLGYLVFYNLRSAGKKALFGILWVLAASKLVQRFITLELGKRSFAYGKNPQLVSSYMNMMMQRLHHEQTEQHDAASNSNNSIESSELLKRCNYVVMGEEELDKTAGPNGCRLVEPITEAIINDDGSPVITVGKIWRLPANDDNNGRLLRNPSDLKRICLSFALYKLLRRRLEDIPIPISSVDAEARNCHDLIFKGLYQEEEEEEAAVHLLQVFNDEIQFLCEYYHSVQPVVFASPFFFLANYVLFPILVCASCILTILLCSNGDVSYAFRSFRDDNRAASDGIIKLPGCILTKITTSAPELFTVVDISVTVLLFLSFAYEEVWEFIVFLLSNWFMVSLLCSYTSNSKPPRRRRWLSRVIRRIMWVRNRLSQPNVCFKQFSVLWRSGCCCHISMALPTKAVPKQAKKAIIKRLADTAAGGVAPAPRPLTKGMAVLESDEHRRFSSWAWECECDGDGVAVAEVILTWHIATELLEAKQQSHRKPRGPNYRKVATALSRYCAYLVAFRPELLPDDKDWTERVYREANKELKKEMGCVWYYCSGLDARSRKLTEMQEEATTTTPLRKGAKLGQLLIEQATDEATSALVWKLLADLWTEIVAYAAPTGSELHVKAHKDALAQGGEFITVLWALTTHTGIKRGQVACV